MITLYRADENGYFLDNFISADVFDGKNPMPDDLTDIRPPDGFFRARWTGSEWVEAATQEEISNATCIQPQLISPTSNEALRADLDFFRMMQGLQPLGLGVGYISDVDIISRVDVGRDVIAPVGMSVGVDIGIGADAGASMAIGIGALNADDAAQINISPYAPHTPHTTDEIIQDYAARGLWSEEMVGMVTSRLSSDSNS